MSLQVSYPSKKTVHFAGILNITPDSFSDGSSDQALVSQIARAERLIEQGADILDIGGDSTRPGSVCIGPDIEWERIGQLVKELAPLYQVSVDTHHWSVARKSLDAGAVMINDISGGSDEMFRVIADSGAKIIIMYSRCSKPHLFDLPRAPDLMKSIVDFFGQKIELAEKCGVKREQIICDPGMGAFLSSNPDDSWLLIREIHKLKHFSPLYIGVSRKGFLSRITEEVPSERDSVSALAITLILRNFSSPTSIYIRSHDLFILQEFLKLQDRLNAIGVAVSKTARYSTAHDEQK